MKLIPTMKLIGNFIVSLIIKLTFLLDELFCIPIIKSKNNDKLKVIVKKNFFNGNNILNFI